MTCTHVWLLAVILVALLFSMTRRCWRHGLNQVAVGIDLHSLHAQRSGSLAGYGLRSRYVVSAT